MQMGGGSMAVKLQPFSVLCVVDGAKSAAALKQILEASGVTRNAITDKVDNLLGILRDAPIDVLVIQDIPGKLDGVELCKLIRTSPDSPNVELPVVLILTDNSIDRTIAATTAGVHEMVVSPVSGSKLLQRLISAWEDERNFVKVDAYVGPDRRCLKKWDYRGPERRDWTTSRDNPGLPAKTTEKNTA